MTNFIYKGDLPDDVVLGNKIAIDTETMGLNLKRDKLCLIQFSSGDGNAHLVQINENYKHSPNICKILKDKKVLKIFHYARFDVAVLLNKFEILTEPIYCTKIASKLVRTFTERHGLKNLVSDLLSIDISKSQQSSDWGRAKLTEEQINYAATDVLYLHQIKDVLDEMLVREKRRSLAEKCFEFVPFRAKLDLNGWENNDIFSHH